MENVNNNGKGKTAVTIVAVVATFLLMTFLVKQMVKVTQPAPVGAERASARARDNADIRAAGVAAAQSWGYADQPRGIVRMPVDDAVKITLQGYQNPAAFKQDLAARLEKANVAPPKPKNEYE